ncbi:MAG: hypothetical protein AAFP88_00915 [Bacteroidota bacterium]
MSGAACQEESQLKTVIQTPTKTDEKPAIETPQEPKEDKTEVTTEEIVAVLLKVVQRLEGTKEGEKIDEMFIGTEDAVAIDKEKIELLKQLQQELRSGSFEQGIATCIALKASEDKISQSEGKLPKEKESAVKNAAIYLKVSEALTALVADDLLAALEKAKEAEAMVGESKEIQVAEAAAVVQDRNELYSFMGAGTSLEAQLDSSKLPPGLKIATGVGVKSKPPGLFPSKSQPEPELKHINELDLSNITISAKDVFFDNHQNLVCVLSLQNENTGESLKDQYVDLRGLEVHLTYPHPQGEGSKTIQYFTNAFKLQQSNTRIQQRYNKLHKNDFFFVINLKSSDSRLAFSVPNMPLKDVHLVGANRTKSEPIDINLDNKTHLAPPAEGVINMHVCVHRSKDYKGEVSYMPVVTSTELISISSLTLYPLHSHAKKHTTLFRKRKKKENTDIIAYLAERKEVFNTNEFTSGEGIPVTSYKRMFPNVEYELSLLLYKEEASITGIQLEYEDRHGKKHTIQQSIDDFLSVQN